MHRDNKFKQFFKQAGVYKLFLTFLRNGFAQVLSST